MAQALRPSDAVTKRLLPILPLLASCAVGPNYHPLVGPDPRGYTETPLAARTAKSATKGGAEQSVELGRAVAGRWWELFRSPDLARLVAFAVRNNPGLEAARQSLRNAQELTLAQYSGLLPSVSGLFSRTHGNFSGAGIPGNPPVSFVYGSYDAQLTINYNFDVWGLARRQIEQRVALADYQRSLLEANYLTLAGNVVSAAITEASLRAQIAAQIHVIDDYSRYLNVIRKQFELGGASGTDVALQQAQLAQAQATLVPLQVSLAQNRDLLAADLGVVPADSHLPTVTLDSLTLPAELPLSLPSNLVEQRPDIREADANLHAATAAVGIAIANRLPQISLNAQVGSQANEPGQLFSPGGGLAYIVTQAVQPIFPGGQLLHQQRAAVATMQEEAALWQQTVIGAFQNVADTLQALSGDSRALVADLTAEQAASRSLDLAQSQYKLGSAAYITVLNAEITYQTDVIALARAQAQRFSDTAALFVALGGGWWNRQDLPPPPAGLFQSLLPWSTS